MWSTANTDSNSQSRVGVTLSANCREEGEEGEGGMQSGRERRRERERMELTCKKNSHILCLQVLEFLSYIQ